MNAIQLNAEILRNMSIVVENESLTKRLANYLRKLTKEISNDPTQMSKEEFFARVDQAKKGPSRTFANVQELDQYIRSL